MIRGIRMVRWVGLSPLWCFCGGFLGRCPRLVWGHAFGAPDLLAPPYLGRWAGGVRRDVGAYLISSVPHVGFVEFDAVFFQEHAKLLLECSLLVVLLLIVNVSAKGRQIRRADGEAAVAALPRKSCEVGRLGFEPFGGRGFEDFHQVGNGKGAG